MKAAIEIVVGKTNNGIKESDFKVISELARKFPERDIRVILDTIPEEKYREQDEEDVLPYKASINTVRFPSKEEAYSVLTTMKIILSAHGFVTVNSYFRLMGSSSDYTCKKYGWTDLRKATVSKDRAGYALKLPCPHLIN